MAREIVPITILTGQVQLTRSTGNLSSRFMRTVVGSGVSVCIWDKIQLSGVMNNFLYPFPRPGDSTTSMFGSVSTKKANNLLDRSGAKRENLIAQILGGARGNDVWDRTGFENITAARKVLQEHKIPVYSEDTGGRMGRKIVFNVHNGNVAVVKVHDLRDSDWTNGGWGKV